MDINAFKYDKYFWIGTVNIPWLSPETNCIIDGLPDAIALREREAFQFASSLPTSTRETLANYIFDEYQSEIYGSMAGGDEITPPISAPSEIWQLLSKPGLTVSDVGDTDRYFAVTFECVWDPEHGLSVLFNDRGLPVDIGGQGDHF